MVFRKLHRKEVHKSAASPLFTPYCYFTPLLVLPLVKSPYKVHGWGKWKFFAKQVCIRCPAQTGTIVCCMCCIWDNISCCTLEMSMSWCDGVIIPSLSISLWAQRQRLMVKHTKPQPAVFKGWSRAGSFFFLSSTISGKLADAFVQRDLIFPPNASLFGVQCLLKETRTTWQFIDKPVHQLGCNHYDPVLCVAKAWYSLCLCAAELHCHSEL